MVCERRSGDKGKRKVVKMLPCRHRDSVSRKRRNFVTASHLLEAVVFVWCVVSEQTVSASKK